MSSYKILILAVILAILGASLVNLLPVKLKPSTDTTNIAIRYTMPNTAPLNMERTVTSVLESGYSNLRGIKTVKSRSSKGFGFINLYFDSEIKPEQARFEVATITRRFYKTFPSELSFPEITINKNDDDYKKPLLSYSINAPLKPYEIQEIINHQIFSQLSAVDGIETLSLFGANPVEWEITYNQNDLRSFGLSKDNLLEVLNKNFTRKNIGQIKIQNELISLSIIPDSPKISWKIPIKSNGSRVIYLTDVAVIRKQEREPSSYFRVNGSNSITLAVFAEKGVNTMELSERFQARFNSLKTSLPQNFQIIKNHDDTIYIKSELDKIFFRSIVTTLILLIFIILTTLSIRYVIVVILSILSNLLIAVVLYYIFQIEIQLYSLAGITISLGLIIDNTIVMVNHIKRQGNVKVVIPILAANLTSVGALSAIFFLKQEYKENLIDFAWVVIINLMVSVLIALFLIPALLKKIKVFPKTNDTTSDSIPAIYRLYRSVIQILLRFKILNILIIILLFGIPLFLLPAKFENPDTFWEKTYNNTLGNQNYTEKIRPVINKYLGGSFRLFSYYVSDNGFYANNEDTVLRIHGSMDKDVTVHQMNEVFLQLEKYLKKFNEIKNFQVNIFSGNYGIAEIQFKEDYSTGSFPYILKANLIRKTLDFGGIDWKITGVGKGYSFGNDKFKDPIVFKIKATGYHYDKLNEWNDILINELYSNPRVKNIAMRSNSDYIPKTSFKYLFRLNREQLAQLKLSPIQVYKDLKSYTISKSRDLTLNINGAYSPVRLESKFSDEFDFWDIKNEMINTSTQPYKLKNIASIDKVIQEEDIYKENQEYLRYIEFEYTGSLKFGRKFLEKKLKEINTKVPLGFKFEEDKNQIRSGKDESLNYFLLLILIGFVIYLICAVLFESYKQPLIILSVIPISFIGVFLTFYFFQFQFDQGGLASFILLCGITVNSSIFIVNDYNQLLREYPDQKKIDLYLLAFKNKIYPILLTIISTVLGFLPFVIYGENDIFWFALSVGTIGGLIFSLLAILIYLPLFTLKRVR